MTRFRWTWLAALLGGLGLGLLYAWVIAPVRYTDTTPRTLRADFKDAFRTAIAASYFADHNLARARSRLELLGDADPVDVLTAQAQRMLAAGESFQTVQQVAQLATDLRAGVASIPASSSPPPTAASVVSPGVVTPSPQSETGTPESAGETPTIESPTVVLSTATPHPTRTAIPTAAAPFQLVSRDQVCNPSLTEGLMQVLVLDNHRHQMPGVDITISWDGGTEDFFTGLKPEIGDGYADYLMQAGTSYTLRVAHSGTPVTGLTAPSCSDTGSQSYTGGLRLTFQQP